MQPFRGIFPPVEGEDGSVFDPALLFAIFMYWLLALGMSALIGWIDRKIVAAKRQAQWDTAYGRRPCRRRRPRPLSRRRRPRPRSRVTPVPSG